MNKGIKILLALLVLVVAGYFGATYWVAGVIEDQWRQQVARISAKTPIEVAVTSYQRSFFGAEVVTTMALPMPPESGEEQVTIAFNSKVAHGPLVFGGGSPLRLATVETTIGAVGGPLQELFRELPELKRLRFVDRVGYGLDYSGFGELPAFSKVLDKEGERINIRVEALQATYSGTLSGKKTVKVNALMPGASVTSENGEVAIEMGRASMQADLQELLDSIYVGTSGIQLDSLKISGPPEEEVNILLTGLKAGAEIKANNGLLEETIVYSIDQLGINDDLYGPALFEVAIGNIDAQVMSRIQSDLQQAQKAAFSANPEQLSEQYFNSLMQNIVPLAKKSPRLEIKHLDVDTPFGNFRSVGQLNIDGNQVMADNPLMVIAATRADADLKIDKSLLQKVATQYLLTSMPPAEVTGTTPEVQAMQANMQAAQTIDGMVAANFLVDTVDAYQVTVKYENGSLFVNGQQMQ